MASSRWKRFAFFDRHTLSLPSEVLEDIISIRSSDGSRRSLRSLDLAGQEASDDSVSMVVTTAALPLASKPVQTSVDTKSQPKDVQEALTGMWSSLSACTSPALAGSEDVESDSEGPLVQLPSQGQMRETNISKSSDFVDGLVLAFVTSRDTELVHCFDTTVRCNPPATGMKDMEDLDGWRGYFAPFAKPPASERRSQSEIASEHIDETESSSVSLVSLACCRSQTAHGAVLLACLGRNKLCVWEDPHLNLSCRRPLTSPPAVPEAKVYTTATDWSANDGEGRVVDIVHNMVAVGTDAGVVLVYVSSPHRSTLHSYLRIPAPPAGGMEAVSVKISLSPEKANIFVAYRRQAATTSQASTAGICCYDVPLPGPSPTTLSAPSARHDLDGRFVGSSSLVDSHGTNSGLQVTVVRVV